MTDQQIKAAVVERDEKVTRQFFFKDCRPLFASIIRHVFSYKVDYDEFVNEFYLYLMENEAHRLRQFQGRSSIYQWMKVVAIRYFVAKRDSMIDMEPREPLSNEPEASYDKSGAISAAIDVRRLLGMMPNKRHVYVLQRLLLDDAEPKEVAEELQVTVDNLYNIKKRAMAALTQMVLFETGKYEKEICK
ncbi:MAG: sigma-70 family RNA polymerase sigma factor [Bacteroidales bacterium]|nr:sigma-70 family RNA polymerase sigma factor [Bacteroidales bacterium]